MCIIPRSTRIIVMGQRANRKSSVLSSAANLANYNYKHVLISKIGLFIVSHNSDRGKCSRSFNVFFTINDVWDVFLDNKYEGHKPHHFCLTMFCIPQELLDLLKLLKTLSVEVGKAVPITPLLPLHNLFRALCWFGL